METLSREHFARPWLAAEESGSPGQKRPRALRRLARKPWRAARRLAGFLRWTCPALRSVLSRPRERRLLAVYDLSAEPFSIGDILIIQEASLVLREQLGLGQVDFAVVYDPQRPTCADPRFSKITPENVLFHLASVLPAAQVNPHHGSLFVFNSHDQLYRFIADNGGFYEVWPDARQFARREYLYYIVFNELLYHHFRKHGTVPKLSCRQFLLDWAETFYARHVCPDVPVTVQVRNNRSMSSCRNLRLEEWFEFFRRCEGRYPVKFVIVCALAEVDERMHRFPNVVVAKAHGTSVEQDLALVQTSAIHLGASSGPGTMAFFNSKPYLLVNTDLVPEYYRGLIVEPGFVRFCFAGPLQRFSLGPETADFLSTEFERMWEVVKEQGAAKASDAQKPAGSEALTWLR